MLSSLLLSSTMNSSSTTPCWYHGHISRISSELSLVREGDFLLRNCISSPGNFVLSCKARSSNRHFKVNRIESECLGERFQFEGPANFSNVFDLIHYHWSEQVPITLASNVLITNPVSVRKEVEEKMAINERMNNASSCNDLSVKPELKQPVRRCRSQRSLNNEKKDENDENDDLSTSFVSDFPADVTVKEMMDDECYDVPGQPRSCLTLEQEQCNRLYDAPRTFFVEEKTASMKPAPPPRRSSRLSSSSTFQIDMRHKIDVCNFKLIRKNEKLKPLQADILLRMHKALTDHQPQRLASLLIKTDIGFFIDVMTSDSKSSSNLLELLSDSKVATLVLERCVTLKLFVVVSVLTATSWKASTAILSTWIQICELCFDAGDLLAFFALITALDHPEIKSVKRLWSSLSASRPQLCSLMCSKLLMKHSEVCLAKSSQSPLSVLVPNCIPYLSTHLVHRLKVCRRLQQDVMSNYTSNREPVSLTSTQLDVLQSKHRDQLRAFKCPQMLERLQSSTKGYESSNDEDSQLLDMFNMHLQKLVLWGSQGCQADMDERAGKLEKAIKVMAALLRHMDE